MKTMTSRNRQLQLTAPGQRVTAVRQRGFTLIELMVAIVISVFLAGGLLMMVQSTRNAFGSQQMLAQLQDNERLVMTFMAEVVESTGYFPDPLHNTNLGVFPVVGVFNTSGQPVFGTHPAAPTGDTVTVRYGAALNDNVFNCRGLTNTTVPNYDVFVNTFSVQPNAANPLFPTLTCTVSSTAINPPQVIPLVNGVQKLVILYGVKLSGADTGSCADTYLNATQVVAQNAWSNVCSINLTMSFTNPLNPAGPPIVIQRVIATMNAAGVNS
jgi:type IV pilus assembly protein PilW